MKRLLSVGLLIAWVIALMASPAFAHSERTVAGVDWSVGWATEPPVAGIPNAIEISLERDGDPVGGAEEDLQVTLALGEGISNGLDPRAVPGDPGSYYAEVIPTDPGEYTITVTGSVDGEDVEETFAGPDDGIEDVREAQIAAFPGEAPASNSELAQRIAGANDDDGGSDMLPLVLSIAALVLALAALIAALRRRPPAPTATAVRAPQTPLDRPPV